MSCFHGFQVFLLVSLLPLLLDASSAYTSDLVEFPVYPSTHPRVMLVAHHTNSSSYEIIILYLYIIRHYN